MDTATFYPRRKAWSSDQEGLKRTSSLPKPVVVSRGALEELMPLSLSQAALKVGLSPTTFKKACRRVGIGKWPYRPDYEKRNKTPRTPPLSTSASSTASLPLSPTMSDRRATTAHGSQQDGADACHAWPSPPGHAWPSPPSSQRSATTSSHDHAPALRPGPREPFRQHPQGAELPISMDRPQGPMSLDRRDTSYGAREGRAVSFHTPAAGVAALPWREAGPLNHHDDKVDSDHYALYHQHSRRHSTTDPSIVYRKDAKAMSLNYEPALEAAPEVGGAVEGVLSYLEDFGQVGGHLASLMERVGEE